MKNNVFSSKKIAIALLFIFLPFNFSSLTLAKAEAAVLDSSLVIQPSKIEITASPGQKVSRNFSIINRSNFNLRLKLAVKDYKQISDDGKLDFYDAEKEPASSWLIPQYLEIGLKPLSTKDISLVINLPEDFSAGGHYGAILFKPADGSDSANIGTSNFGELVLLTVTGGEEKISAIAKTIDFKTTGIQKGDPVNFSLKMQNTGNTHFVTQGKIVIKSWRGKEVGNFNAGQLVVYPGTTRVFKWRWNDAPYMGVLRANLMLSDPSSSQNPKLVDGMWFIIFPWHIVLTVLLSALAIFFAIRYRKSLSLKKIYKLASSVPKKAWTNR